MGAQGCLIKLPSTTPFIFSSWLAPAGPAGQEHYSQLFGGERLPGDRASTYSLLSALSVCD